MTRLPPRDDAAAKFLRGLTIGALVGAVIAGSSLWSRRTRSAPRVAGDLDAEPAENAADADLGPVTDRRS